MSERCVPACVGNDNSPYVSCSQPSLRCQECLLEVPQRYINEIYLYLHFKTINLLIYYLLQLIRLDLNSLLKLMFKRDFIYNFL